MPGVLRFTKILDDRKVPFGQSMTNAELLVRLDKEVAELQTSLTESGNQLVITQQPVFIEFDSPVSRQWRIKGDVVKASRTTPWPMIVEMIAAFTPIFKKEFIPK